MSNGGVIQDDRRMMPPPPPSAAPRLTSGELTLDEHKQQLQHTQPRIFYRWRIMLNEKRELIVKGKDRDEDNGTPIKSKPITSILSAKQLQSGNRYIYELHGGIADGHRVLPNYIRQKFAEGFPIDWQNVHQLWIEYLDARPSSNFRWPTNLNDVDDDIQSIVTEYSFLRSKDQQNRSNISPKSDSNHSSLGYHSKIQSDSNQEPDRCKEPQKVQDTASETDHGIEKSDHSRVSATRKSEQKSVSKSASLKNLAAENCSSSYSSLCTSSCLTKFFSEENRKIIYDGLKDGCPPEMIDKFLAMTDFLRFLVSKQEGGSDVHTDSLNMSKSNSQSCSRCSNSEIDNTSEAQEVLSSKKLEKMKDDEANVNLKGKESSDSSDNEALLGIPNVALDHLLKPTQNRLNRLKTRISTNENRTIPISQSKKHCEVLNHNSSISVLEDDPDETRQSKFKDKDRALSHSNFHHVVQSNGLRNTNHSEGLSKDLREKPVMKSIVPVQVDLSSMNVLKRQNSYLPSVTPKETDSMKKQKLMNANITKPNAHEDEDYRTMDELLSHKFINFDSEDYLEENQIKLLPNRYNNEEFKKNFKLGRSVTKDEVEANRPVGVGPDKKERKPLQPQFSSNSSASDHEQPRLNQLKSRVAPEAQKEPSVAEKTSNPARKSRKKRVRQRQVTKPVNGRYNMRLRNRELKPQPGVEWTYDRVQNQNNQLSDCEDL
ncbi:hypothetical protein QAD02_010762 [Eretmocerus hayati]|uniref:Uncharacterized protein n=1 Tax=Eretmocerus hayati TaxID=131215 RepID=A0ACC2NUZ6_9HYME|nr:hypothetical protein QAD02_010762 [Eretmocerus hayati]